MPARAELYLHAASSLPEERERSRDEAVVVVLGDQHLVRGGEHVGGGVVHGREGTDRVPRRGRHRGGVLALAADVAHRDAPAVSGLEHVVEVAADLVELRRADVGRGELKAGYLGQPRGQQAGLQRLGDLRPLAEHPVDPDGDRQVPAELLGEAEVGDTERSLVRQPRQRQRAVAGRPVGDRNADQRGRSQDHAKRRAVGAAPERGRVIEVREQHRLARRVHQGGQGLLVGIDAPRHAGHLVRLAAARARPRTGAAACRPGRCR